MDRKDRIGRGVFSVMMLLRTFDQQSHCWPFHEFSKYVLGALLILLSKTENDLLGYPQVSGDHYFKYSGLQFERLESNDKTKSVCSTEQDEF